MVPGSQRAQDLERLGYAALAYGHPGAARKSLEAAGAWAPLLGLCALQGDFTAVRHHMAAVCQPHDCRAELTAWPSVLEGSLLRRCTCRCVMMQRLQCTSCQLGMPKLSFAELWQIAEQAGIWQVYGGRGASVVVESCCSTLVMMQSSAAMKMRMRSACRTTNINALRHVASKTLLCAHQGGEKAYAVGQALLDVAEPRFSRLQARQALQMTGTWRVGPNDTGDGLSEAAVAAPPGSVPTMEAVAMPGGSMAGLVPQLDPSALEARQHPSNTSNTLLDSTATCRAMHSTPCLRCIAICCDDACPALR